MKQLPFVISVPHCSQGVPVDIQNTLALDEQQVLESVDFGTLEIFGKAPALEVVAAQWSRLIADLNRGPDQLDPKGVAALTDYHGRPIYKPGMEPDRQTIADRVAQYHQPYHSRLLRAVENRRAIGIIDGHSLNGVGPVDSPDPHQRRKDVILSNNGDLEGRSNPASGPATCTRDQLLTFSRAFQNQGFSVSLNWPYQGGYIINRFGRLFAGDHRLAVQIELNQNLYMLPGSLEPDRNRVSDTARRVVSALEEVAAILTEGDRP